jgi:hypothetical protein
MKYPYAQVATLFRCHSSCPDLTLSAFLLMSIARDNSTSNQGVPQGSGPCPAGKLCVDALRVVDVSYTIMQFVGFTSAHQ